MKRRYPALEKAVGKRLPVKASATALIRSRKEKPLPARNPVHQKLQVMLEKTVQTLLLTASPTGDLAFRADIKAAVMSDLSVDVIMVDRRQLLVTFYTTNAGVRRLLLGYERALVQHLESRGIKVKQVRVLNAPDPNEPPPVPLT